MKTDILNIEQILNIDKWQELQDSLAEATKLAIITVDYKGRPVTQHSTPRPFCQKVRSNPELVKYCYKCDSRGGLEAVRINAPYIYLCHCNIVDLAIPITIDGQYIGATLAGQVRLPDNERNNELENIMVSPRSHTHSIKELESLYEDIPILSYKDIQAVANMLFNLCGYIVQEAVKTNLLGEIHKQFQRNIQIIDNHELFSGYPISSIEFVKRTANSAMTKSYITTTESECYVCKNAVLKPAFAYINEHKGEQITQKKVADLCHISIHHFSRLFVKEVGESFPSFLSRQRVEWAKQLLQKTELSISQVSDGLGFGAPAYFIKIFKRYENVTPAVYRKYYLDRI